MASMCFALRLSLIAMAGLDLVISGRVNASASQETSPKSRHLLEALRQRSSNVEATAPVANAMAPKSLALEAAGSNVTDLISDNVNPDVPAATSAALAFPPPRLETVRSHRANVQSGDEEPEVPAAIAMAPLSVPRAQSFVSSTDTNLPSDSAAKKAARLAANPESAHSLIEESGIFERACHKETQEDKCCKNTHHCIWMSQPTSRGGPDTQCMSIKQFNGIMNTDEARSGSHSTRTWFWKDYSASLKAAASMFPEELVVILHFGKDMEAKLIEWNQCRGKWKVEYVIRGNKENRYAYSQELEKPQVADADKAEDTKYFWRYEGENLYRYSQEPLGAAKKAARIAANDVPESALSLIEESPFFPVNCKETEEDECCKHTQECIWLSITTGGGTSGGQDHSTCMSRSKLNDAKINKGKKWNGPAYRELRHTYIPSRVAAANMHPGEIREIPVKGQNSLKAKLIEFNQCRGKWEVEDLTKYFGGIKGENLYRYSQSLRPIPVVLQGQWVADDKAEVSNGEVATPLQPA